MDRITSKRILIALARKLSFDTVKRVNAHTRRVNAHTSRNGYMLKLVGKKSAYLGVRPIGAANTYCNCDISNSSKWSKMLEALVGKEIGYGYLYNGYLHKPIVVHSIEQLAIDLELEGWLKNV